MAIQIGITLIADRYAEAILELAQEKECLEYVKNDLLIVTATLQQTPDLKEFMEHPIVSVKDKKEVLQTIFADKVNPYVINLMKILLDRNRLFILTAIADSFKKLFNKRFNIALATVTTAIEIDEDTKNNIKEKLSQLLSKQVELNTKVNTDIIGGVIIQIEDSIIDGSINGRLEDLKRQIT